MNYENPTELAPFPKESYPTTPAISETGSESHKVADTCADQVFSVQIQGVPTPFLEFY